MQVIFDNFSHLYYDKCINDSSVKSANRTFRQFLPDSFTRTGRDSPWGYVCPLPQHFQEERIAHERQDEIRSTKEAALAAAATAICRQPQCKGQALLLYF